MPFEFQSLGEQTLKGFDEPVRAFAASLKDGHNVPDPDSPPKEIETELPSQNDLTDSTQTQPPQKTSLAVLPFSTVGRSADTEDIADGITDVLINTLSRTGMSEIADRASTFSYKGQTPRPADVSKALGVQHVLQGSVQQSGSRVRITAELFDAEANNHVWSERFDCTDEDVFQLQDDIAKRITQSVRTVIVLGVDWEVENDNFDAWLLNIQGVEYYSKHSAGDNRHSRKLCEEVMELDPEYAYGPCNVAWTHYFDCIYGWSESATDSLAKAWEFSERTFEVDRSDKFLHKHGQRGLIHALRGEYDEAAAQADLAVGRLPDDSSAMAEAGMIFFRLGDLKRGRELLEHSVKLLNRPFWFAEEGLGVCYSLCAQHREALAMFERWVGSAADPTFPHALKAVAYIELDEPDRAQSEMKQALEHRPELALRHFHYYLAFRDQAQRKRFSDVLVQAGLPG